MIATEDVPGMPLGLQVLAVFQPALLVATNVFVFVWMAVTVKEALLVVGAVPEAAARIFVPGWSRLRSLKWATPFVSVTRLRVPLRLPVPEASERVTEAPAAAWPFVP